MGRGGAGSRPGWAGLADRLTGRPGPVRCRLGLGLTACRCPHRTSILSEVSTRARSKLPSGKNILVFGEDGSGKTTLMTKLQGAEHGKKGRGLEYLYLSIHDEDRDDHTRCNVWILDGDLYHKGLLKFAVSAESLPETLVIFVADMSRPWTVMESLQKWASVLREHIDKMKIPPEEMRALERKCK